MIYSKRIPHGFGGQILPKGDRYDLPRGRRQFSLASLMCLLGTTCMTAALCRWFDGGGVDYILSILLAIWIWWSYAERRDGVTRIAAIDQRKLREEVRRWLHATTQRQHGVAAEQVTVSRANRQDLVN